MSLRCLFALAVLALTATARATSPAWSEVRPDFGTVGALTHAAEIEGSARGADAATWRAAHQSAPAVRRAVLGKAYAVRRTEAPSTDRSAPRYEALNPRQALAASFTRSGIEVTASSYAGDAWRWGM